MSLLFKVMEQSKQYQLTRNWEQKIRRPQIFVYYDLMEDEKEDLIFET